MTGAKNFDVVIVGGGAAGIAVASSLLKRTRSLTLAIIDAADDHYYQPGWTLVGGGVFDAATTKRSMASVIPEGVTWIKQKALAFSPNANEVGLADGSVVNYDQLVVCPGLKLNWAGIKGLEENLGKNGVTSNYSYKTASYTWDLVRSMKSGKALFTQPPMPIKCAGAPQKALYLSADHWRRSNTLSHMDIGFYTATPGLFGVAHYVPALMRYIDRYGVDLNCEHNLIAIDGDRKVASFATTDGVTVDVEYDLLHVCPPQCAPDIIRESALADTAGWVDVDPETLRSRRFDNVWSLGDVINAPNAKTAAAARAQAPVVAVNLLESMGLSKEARRYDGYGSCPLTVERGKIVLAEFGYGGQLLPSFPAWLIDGQYPSTLAWLLKAKALPWIYWHAMLKGREWLIKPLPQA